MIGFALQNVVDDLNANVIASRQLNFTNTWTGCGILSDCLNFGCRQLCRRSFFSSVGFVSPFINHVSYIISLSSKKQMFWIAAWGVVATMKNLHTFWDKTIGKCVCNSVSRTNLLSANTDLTISVRVDIPCPDPAVASLINFSPQSRNKVIISSTFCIATMRTKSTIAPSNLVKPSPKWIRASFTDFIYQLTASVHCIFLYLHDNTMQQCNARHNKVMWEFLNEYPQGKDA